MYTKTPRLEIYPDRIAANARSVLQMCHAHGARVACVTKVLCAHPAVQQALVDAGADMLADSRIQNLQAIGENQPGIPRLLLRLPAVGSAEDAVLHAEYSLNSSLQTLAAISRAAGRLNKTHRAIVMVDVGDLREGVWRDRVVPLVTEAARLPNLEIAGLGANLACYGGVIPTRENMQILVECRDACRKATGLPLDLISGGNSANLPLLAGGGMPREINHFRIGEAIILGRNVLDRSPWQGTRQDGLRVVAEVIELESKPSVPIGRRGQDAFGNQVEFVDRGIRQRALLNLGRQDVDVDGLMPEDEGIIVLGGSSDHLVLDVSDARHALKLGDEVGFMPTYSALLAASTSPYVEKVVIPG
ncbi:MAG TPA: alanine/ornithine racemase family PLP-dependent enzyme [Anaerolineaceae bacterium]|nr:alanine/ornithine racemase family PLP-dependent enzyme [Anaerolineaceae bacterium]HOH21204.1 alanine/ornithine racemase family PLP-dependent enzyme [Anaerolineaceae bacterium]